MPEVDFGVGGSLGDLHLKSRNPYLVMIRKRIGQGEKEH